MKHARPDYNRIQDPSGKIPDDEPVFLIRGQDRAAPEALRRYAEIANRLGAAPALTAATLKQADDMEAWQLKHGNKVPDMPAYRSPPQERKDP